MDDVSVLREACCGFRNLFLKLDPFRQTITISSMCTCILNTFKEFIILLHGAVKGAVHTLLNEQNLSYSS